MAFSRSGNEQVDVASKEDNSSGTYGDSNMMPRPNYEEVERLLSRFEVPETPDEMELSLGQRVVAIGDVHGNISSKKAGGAVVLLFGNHEVSNAVGDFACSRLSVVPQWTDALSSIMVQLHGAQWQHNDKVPAHPTDAGWTSNRDPARWAAFRPGGLLAKPFLSKLKVMFKVGKTVFVHAGFRSHHVPVQGGIASMNAIARKWILGDATQSLQAVTSTPASNAEVEKDLPSFMTPNGVDSMLVMRDYSHISRKASDDELAKLRQDVDEALAAVRANLMVVGHSVQPDGITKTSMAECGASIWETAYHFDTG